jgi:CheY-like chemotaxis protein
MPRILIVDRNEMSCLALEQALESWGYEPVFAHDLSSALVAFEATKPAAVIIAVDQPETEGRAVFHAIRSRDDGLLTEALFITTQKHLGSIPPRAPEDSVFFRPVDLEQVIERRMRTIGAPRIAPLLAEEKATVMPGYHRPEEPSIDAVDSEVARAEAAAKEAAADAFDESMEAYEREYQRARQEEHTWAEAQKDRVTRNLSVAPEEDPTEASAEHALPSGWSRALSKEAPRFDEDATEFQWSRPPPGFGFEVPTSVHGALSPEPEVEGPSDRVALLSRLESSGISGTLLAEVDGSVLGQPSGAWVVVGLHLSRGRLHWASGPVAERAVTALLRDMGARSSGVSVGHRAEFSAWASARGFPRSFVDAVAWAAAEHSLTAFVEHARHWQVDREEGSSGAPCPWRSLLAEGLSQGPPRFRPEQRFAAGSRPWRRDDLRDALIVSLLAEGVAVDLCCRLFGLTSARVAALAWIACAEGVLVEAGQEPLEQGELPHHTAQTLTRTRPHFPGQTPVMPLTQPTPSRAPPPLRTPAPSQTLTPSRPPPPLRAPAPSRALTPSRAETPSLRTLAGAPQAPQLPPATLHALSDWLESSKNSDYFSALGLPRTAETAEVDRASARILEAVRSVRNLGTEEAQDLAERAEAALEEALAVLLDPELCAAYRRHIR